MPDLGKYALEVGIAYGASLAMLLALVAFVLWRSARVQKTLRTVEARLPGRSDT